MITWEGYEFLQDRNIMELYCKHKKFTLLEVRKCLGYGKKILGNHYIFIKLNFPKCPKHTIAQILKDVSKRAFSVRLLTNKQIMDGTPFERGYTMVIDLKKSENELWNNLKKKRRNEIRQGYRRGVKVTIIDESRLEEWINVYINTARRKGFSQLPQGLLLDLFGLKNTFFFAAIVNNKIASVALVVSENNHLYWWVGGTDLKYQWYRPNDVLHWEIIKWGLENQFEYYDMCGLVLDKDHGPTKFKLGYNGEIIPYYIYNVNKGIIGKIVNNMI